ncbi:hypothetical protein K3495_g14687 [Podosphaera aphanis]|nr:hypothetical protein K3495_g14687 [Podosphaera aphanis]
MYRDVACNLKVELKLILDLTNQRDLDGGLTVVEYSYPKTEVKLPIPLNIFLGVMNSPQTPPQSPISPKYAPRLTRNKRLQVRTLAREGLSFNMIAERPEITHGQVRYATNIDLEDRNLQSVKIGYHVWRSNNCEWDINGRRESKMVLIEIYLKRNL